MYSIYEELKTLKNKNCFSKLIQGFANELLKVLINRI